MSVSAVGHTTHLQQAHRSGGPGGAGGPGGPGGPNSPFKAVSMVLGMSEQDVATQVKGGKSLADIAKDQGVSNDDLRQALVNGLPEGVRNSPGIDSMIDSVMNQKGMPSGPPPGGPGGPGSAGRGGFGGQPSGAISGNLNSSQSRMIDLLAKVLDTNSDDLTTKLSSGTSLTQLLADKGVKPEQLASVIESGLLFDAKA